MTRRQLPVHSPVSPLSITRGAATALGSPGAVRARLRAHLVDRFGAERVVLTGSGTQALTLALGIARSGGRDAAAPVALPAFSCYDIVTAAVGADVPVLFYDIDPETLAPDMTTVRAALEGGARTLVVGGLFGFPVDWPLLAAACRSAGAVLVEDAAQSLGSAWQGREGGSFGDLTVLSFGRGKGWTGGAGGALLIRVPVEGPASDVPSVAPMPRGTGLRALVSLAAQWTLGRPLLYDIPTRIPGLALGETHYREPEPCADIPGLAAGIVLANASAARRAVGTRRRRAAGWSELWQSERPPAGLEPCRPLDECGFLRFPVVAETPEEAERVAVEGRYFGVARSYPIPLPELPAARSRTVQAGAAPGARTLAANLVTLPTHALVSEADVRGVARLLGEASPKP